MGTDDPGVTDFWYSTVKFSMLLRVLSVYKGRSCSDGHVRAEPLEGQVVRRGFLRSPNWPGEYPAGVDCQWTISAERGRRVLVVVSRVELATTSDISRITDEHHCTTTNSSAPGDWLFISDTTGGFSTSDKLFHCQNQEKICINTTCITKDPITPQVCRCTTLAAIIRPNCKTTSNPRPCTSLEIDHWLITPPR